MKLKSGTTQTTLIIAITVFVLVLPVVPVTATDFTDMTLTYDFNFQILTVNASHYTSNTKTHYVETIEIWRNGISVHNQTYENQTNSWWEYDAFNVSASVGDNLTVTATESKGDSITRWLIVTSGTAINPITDTTGTTGPTDTASGPGSPITTSNIGPVIAVVVFLVVFFIVLFALLNPDKVPDAIRHLGTRVKDGFSRIWVGLGNLFSRVKAKVAQNK